MGADAVKTLFVRKIDKPRGRRFGVVVSVIPLLTDGVRRMVGWRFRAGSANGLSAWRRGVQ